MSRNATKPGLAAAMTAGRALLAAGWRYDSTSPMADDSTIRTLLHPTGREIHARTDDRDGDTTSLTMTGLSLEQVAGAVTGAGLTAPAPVEVAAVNAEAEQGAPDPRAELVAGLRALADFYEANPTMPLPVYPDLMDTGEPGAPDAEDVERLHRQAALLGVEVETRASGHMYAVRQFAGLTFRAAHSPSRALAAHNALQSYAGSVQTEAVAQ